MSRIDVLSALKERAANLRRETDQAKGRLEELLKNLKDEFDTDSPEEAEKLLKKLQKEETKAEKDFEEGYETFMEEWEDQL